MLIEIILYMCRVSFYYASMYHLVKVSEMNSSVTKLQRASYLCKIDHKLSQLQMRVKDDDILRTTFQNPVWLLLVIMSLGMTNALVE